MLPAEPPGGRKRPFSAPVGRQGIHFPPLVATATRQGFPATAGGQKRRFRRPCARFLRARPCANSALGPLVCRFRCGVRIVRSMVVFGGVPTAPGYRSRSRSTCLLPSMYKKIAFVWWFGVFFHTIIIRSVSYIKCYNRLKKHPICIGGIQGSVQMLVAF